MSPKNYTIGLLLLSCLISLLILVLNYFVDPYAIFGVNRIPGFNQYKVDINNFTRLTKKYQPGQRPFDALIIGNSRVEMGINPDHPCFRDAGWAVYNLGLPGAGVRTQIEYALNVMYQQPVKAIFLSLDFTDFLATDRSPTARVPLAEKHQPGQLRYLASGELNPDFFEVRLVDYYKSLFSLDATVSSVKTILLQSDRATDRDIAGFNPARDYAEAVRIEGARALFEQKMSELGKKYASNWFLRDANGRLSRSFDDVAEFLVMTEMRGIEVYLFTNPFHDSYWTLMEKNGLRAVYSDWRRSMVELVREYPSESLAFWDFAGDSRYIHEPVPPADVTAVPLDWFWEPAHYREQLGELMVDAMLSDECGTPVVLGRKLR